MEYTITDTRVVNEPSRGSNYSPFYFTKYITVQFVGVDGTIEFPFFAETEQEVIDNFLANYGS